MYKISHHKERYYPVLIQLSGELCFTVECKYSPWSSWSASCGPATRTRTQITEEIEVEAASCDGLPLECHGQMDETQTRDTPCKNTVKSHIRSQAHIKGFCVGNLYPAE